MYVYVLKSKKDGSLYVGSTKNIRKRLQQHNRGHNSSTKAKLPWILVMTEEYDDKSLALKREKFLKSGKGKQVIRNLS